MAISGMVLLNIIGLYLFVQKQYINYKVYNNEEIELAQFSSVFTNDIDFASEIKLNQRDILIKRNSGQELKYSCNKNNIIRTGTKIDTFSITVKKMVPIQLWELELIEQINMEIQMRGKIRTLSFFKDYDNAAIVNFEIKQNENGN